MRKILVLMVLLIFLASSMSFLGSDWSGASDSCDVNSDTRGQPHARKTVEYITKFYNNLEELEMEFGTGGGTNQMLNVSLPKRSKVLSASIDVEGLPVLDEYVYDYTDTKNNSAWKGYDDKLPSSSKPSNYEDVEYSNTEYGYVTKDDNDGAQNDGGSTSNTSIRLYHLFKFTVKAPSPNKFRFVWKGEAWATLTTTRMYLNEANSYIYCPTNTTWVKFDFQTTTTVNPAKITVNKEIANAGNYIGSTNSSVYIMVVGPNLVANMNKGIMKTCYVKLSAFGGAALYPTGVGLDVGGDGDKEWTHASTLNSKVTVNDATLKSEIQEHIDNAGTDEGDFRLLLEFSTATEGRLWVGNLNISVEALDHNDAPTLVPGQLIEFFMTEDDTASGDNLIDLSLCFEDLQESVDALQYGIEFQENEALLAAQLDADGHHVDFIPALNYYGTLKFRVNASDSGADEAPGTFDDLACSSDFFKVTVRPVNDVPVINVDSEKWSVNESHILRFNVTVTDVDDTEFTWKSNVTDRVSVKPRTYDESTAEVMVNPAEEDTGKSIYFQLTVTDSGGGQDEIYKAESHKDLVVDVNNINNPPKFVDFTIEPDYYTEPIIKGAAIKLKNNYAAAEDEYFNITVTATDPDFGFEPKEALTFDIMQDEPLDGMLDIDPVTGLVSLLPTNADVGTIEFTVTVTDWQGESASSDWEVQVKNRNDAPMNVRIIMPEERKFTTDDKIDFWGEAEDDDLDVPEANEGLNFIWTTNHSAEPLGTGEELYDKSLSEGWHKITLKVIDSKGDFASTYIELQVVPVHIDPDPIDDDDDDDVPDDEEDDDKSDFIEGSSSGKGGISTSLAALAFIVVIVLIVAAVLFNFMRAKKKKDEDGSVPLTMAQLPGMDPSQMYQMPYGLPPQPQPVIPTVFPQPQQGAAGVSQPQQFQEGATAAPAGMPQLTRSNDPGAITVQAQTPTQEQLNSVQTADLPQTKPIQK